MYNLYLFKTYICIQRERERERERILLLWSNLHIFVIFLWFWHNGMNHHIFISYPYSTLSWAFWWRGSNTIQWKRIRLEPDKQIWDQNSRRLVTAVGASYLGPECLSPPFLTGRLMMKWDACARWFCQRQVIQPPWFSGSPFWKSEVIKLALHSTRLQTVSWMYPTRGAKQDSAKGGWLSVSQVWCPLDSQGLVICPGRRRHLHWTDARFRDSM